MITAYEAKDIAIRKTRNEGARKASRKTRKWNIFDSIELIQTLFWIKHEAKNGNLCLRHHLPTRPLVYDKLVKNGYRIRPYIMISWDY